MTADVDRFRAELRSWLEANLTPEIRDVVRHGDRDSDEAFATHRRWNAALFDAGYGAVAWPFEHGGREAGIEEQLAYHEEMARAGAPGPVNAIGVANIAPAIIEFGPNDVIRGPLHSNDSLLISLTWSSRMTPLPGVPATAGPKFLPT